MVSDVFTFSISYLFVCRGMRGLQGTCARLRTRLPADKLRRAAIVQACVRLYNVRVRSDGINQIATVFGGAYSDEVLADEPHFDRVQRYYNLQ